MTGNQEQGGPAGLASGIALTDLTEKLFVYTAGVAMLDRMYPNLHLADRIQTILERGEDRNISIRTVRNEYGWLGLELLHRKKPICQVFPGDIDLRKHR